jgi:hypothetical protein
MTKTSRAAGALALAFGLATASAALAQEDVPAPAEATTDEPAHEVAPPDGQRGPVPPVAAPADVSIIVKNASGGTVKVNDRVKAIAKIRPFVQGETMQIRFAHGGKVIKRRNMHVRQMGNRNVGKVDLKSRKLLDPGDYRAVAVHRASPAQQADNARSRRFHPVYPDLDPGNRNRYVGLFKNLLDKQAYYVGDGRKYDSGTERAVMAFRKTNNMSRSWNATPAIFKTLAAGKGGFKLNNPGAGKHVEVDISRQVMALADNGKAKHVFHVSTGAPATPSDKGTFRFYRKDPGYNSIGMYYSVYYNGGEATHGYKSVPPYNASHGCIRNPIPNSRFIYNWISLGNTMHVYR